MVVILTKRVLLRVFGIIKVGSSDWCDAVCATEGWPCPLGVGVKEDRLGREDTISYTFTGHLRDTQRPGALMIKGAGRISRQKAGVGVPVCEEGPRVLVSLA